MSNDSREYWNARARKYGEDGLGWKAVCIIGDADWANSLVHSLQARAISRSIKIDSGMRILDVGCGVGRWSLRFAQLGAQVSACDASHEMVLIARKRAEEQGLDVNFFVQPIEELSSELEDSFDLVTSVTVLQHITDNDRFRMACSNLVKVTKKDGRILIVETVVSKLRSRRVEPHVVSRTRHEFISAFGEAGAILIAESGVRFMKLEEYWRQLAGNLVRRLFGFDRITSNIEIQERMSSGSVGSKLAVLIFNGIRMVILTIQKPFDWFLSSALTSLAYERALLFQKTGRTHPVKKL